MVAFDLDGVIWRGEDPLPGVRTVVPDVLRRGLVLRYVSNNSTAHRRTYSERLERLGLPAGCERVLATGFITGRWLRTRLPASAPVMVIGESGLLEELSEAGLDPHHARLPWPDHLDPPAAVIVGLDRHVDFQTLTVAHAAVRAGALFVATNQDPTLPTSDGESLGAGAIVAAVATATGIPPVLMGKPGLALAEVLAASTAIPAEETLFVGDRLSTDIVMGEAAGMTTVLVMTGVTTPEELAEVRRRAEAARAQAAQRAEGDSGQCATLDRGLGAALVLPDLVLPDHVLTDLTGLPALLDSLQR